MLQLLKTLFTDREAKFRPAVPAGQRIYAIGDIHGRLDLFESLADAIERDDHEAGSAETTVILLGDLVDRGPASAGVLRFARDWQSRRRVRILCGNHEEMFLRSFDDSDMMRHFMRHGGRQTVLSYGIDAKALGTASVAEMQAMMRDCVPKQDRDYIAAFEDMIPIGDFVFVHAGINPEAVLAEQRPQDLRWIREPFLSHSEPHEKVVVHGHTIFDEVQDRGNRIGIDTGAYSTGRLTALVIEGSERRFIQAVERDDGTIAVKPMAPAR